MSKENSAKLGRLGGSREGDREIREISRGRASHDDVISVGRLTLALRQPLRPRVTLPACRSFAGVRPAPRYRFITSRMNIAGLNATRLLPLRLAS